MEKTMTSTIEPAVGFPFMLVLVTRTLFFLACLKTFTSKVGMAYIPISGRLLLTVHRAPSSSQQIVDKDEAVRRIKRLIRGLKRKLDSEKLIAAKYIKRKEALGTKIPARIAEAEDARAFAQERSIRAWDNLVAAEIENDMKDLEAAAISAAHNKTHHYLDHHHNHHRETPSELVVLREAAHVARQAEVDAIKSEAQAYTAARMYKALLAARPKEALQREDGLLQRSRAHKLLTLDMLVHDVDETHTIAGAERTTASISDDARFGDLPGQSPSGLDGTPERLSAVVKQRRSSSRSSDGKKQQELLELNVEYAEKMKETERAVFPEKLQVEVMEALIATGCEEPGNPEGAKAVFDAGGNVDAGWRLATALAQYAGRIEKEIEKLKSAVRLAKQGITGQRTSDSTGTGKTAGRIPEDISAQIGTLELALATSRSMKAAVRAGSSAAETEASELYSIEVEASFAWRIGDMLEVNKSGEFDFVSSCEREYIRNALREAAAAKKSDETAAIEESVGDNSELMFEGKTPAPIEMAAMGSIIVDPSNAEAAVLPTFLNKIRAPVRGPEVWGSVEAARGKIVAFTGCQAELITSYVPGAGARRRFLEQMADQEDLVCAFLSFCSLSCRFLSRVRMWSSRSAFSPASSPPALPVGW